MCAVPSFAIHYSVSVRDLNVTLDSIFSFSDQINCTSWTCLCHPQLNYASSVTWTNNCTRMTSANWLMLASSQHFQASVNNYRPCPTYWWCPEVCAHNCLYLGNSSPLASCAKAHLFRNSNIYSQLSVRVRGVHSQTFCALASAPWPLHSPLNSEASLRSIYL